MTSVALMSASAGTPALSFSLRAAPAVMIEVSSCPPMSNVTSASRPEIRTFVTTPASLLLPLIASREETPAAPEPRRARKDPGPRAVQDEWGLYDPHAAGFEALFAKLESIENGPVRR